MARVQLEVDGDATYVHVTVVPPLTAVNVTVSPSFTPLAATSGVVSFVMLSVVEVPVSDELRSSGAEGAVIAVTIAVSVEEVFRLMMSCTEYVTDVALPTKPPTGENETIPVCTSTLQVPSPFTVIDDSVQTGGVSLGPQRLMEFAARLVPLSFKSGVKEIVLSAFPDAESAVADGAVGA